MEISNDAWRLVDMADMMALYPKTVTLKKIRIALKLHCRDLMLGKPYIPLGNWLGKYGNKRRLPSEGFYNQVKLSGAGSYGPRPRLDKLPDFRKANTSRAKK